MQVGVTQTGVAWRQGCDFIEDLFGLPEMTVLDSPAGTDDLFTDFCFTCQPAGFTPIKMNGHTVKSGTIYRDSSADIDG